MPFNKNIRRVAILLIALVWLVNGLVCKVLNLVPRHQQIVARVLGQEHAPLLTRTIGVLEMLMAIWVLSGISRGWCARLQMVLVITMNVLEFVLVPDLLLFGRLNIVFAFIFAGFIYYVEWGSARYQLTKAKR